MHPQGSAQVGLTQLQWYPCPSLVGVEPHETPGMLSQACGLHITLAQTPASVVVTHDAASTGASLAASLPPSSPDPELLLLDELPLLELDEPELLPLLDPELLLLPLLDPDELPPLEPLLELELDPLDPLSLQPVPATAATSAADATTPPKRTKRSFMPATVAPATRHGSPRPENGGRG
jgi:hypothetical protein